MKNEKTVLFNQARIQERIVKDWQELKQKGFDQHDSYLISYPEFVNYFKNVNPINKHHLIIGIHFVYGWMPRVFSFTSTDFDESVRCLNEVNSGGTLSDTQIEVLKGLLKNSLVGTSKLLHFINPSRYAIWDRRVLRYLLEQDSMPHHYQMKETQTFLNYQALMNNLSEQDFAKVICRTIQEKLNGQIVSPLRALEMVMFYTDKKKYGGKDEKQ